MYSRNEIIVLGITLLIMLIITIITTFLLRKKSPRVKQLPFLIINILLIIFEIIKQVLEIESGYSMWAFPLHFCSTYFIWFSLANFSKRKFSEAMKSVAIVASFYLVALFYINPVSIIGDACNNIFLDFSTFHTFFFHHLVILYFMLSIALNQLQPRYSHIIYWLVSMTIYYVTAVTFANIFNVNYMNILESNIGFMESLRISCGQVIYNIVLGLATVGCGAIIIAVVCKIRQHIQHRKMLSSNNNEINNINNSDESLDN